MPKKTVTFSWKRRPVLITGAGGFIGSHLTERLVELGADVKVFVHYNALGKWGWLDDLPCRTQIEVLAGDIADRDMVRAAVQDCDTVFHLAALIGIPYSYHAPESYVRTNIIGTLNILQAARECGVRRLLQTSTSETYGTALYVPIDEKHPFQGQSPYSATKIGADRLAESFWRSFGVPVTIVRPFNTYGPRQSMRAVIPTIITQLLTGSTKIRLGSLTPTRDFNYVTDTCTGFIALAEAEAAVGEEVNIASQQEISIGTMAAELIRQINPQARIVTEQKRKRPAKSEVDRLLGANAKIRKLTGWAPHFTLKTGVAETIAWFRQPGNLARYKSDDYQV